MDYKKVYEEWVNNPYFDEAFRKELKSISNDPKELEDRFYRNLEFGTGGLRGVIGAGTNRINKYNVRKATQGYANYLNENFGDQKNLSIAVAYDSRRMSVEFALETALVMCANGIKAYLFETLHSTPELSYAVRTLKCVGGVVVTASHNPPEYNGYKAYDERGCQMLPEKADMLISEVEKITDFEQVKFMDKDQALSLGLLEYIGLKLDAEYLSMIHSLSLSNGNIDKGVRVVYTPLHGTGARPVVEAIKAIGIEHITCVDEQMIPDPNFKTLEYPNPEDIKAFALAIEYGKKVQADILLATDPDCDRVGLMVKNDAGDYIALNGNQTGALLVDYVLELSKDKIKNPVVVKTIVTSDMGKVIAESKGAMVEETLTGFKFIGDIIYKLENDSSKNFVIGYEESYGYLAGTEVRDKDAVVSSMLIVEMTAYYKKQGKSLLTVLSDLYKKFGYYKEDLVSITLKGKDGLERMGRIMKTLRDNPFNHVAGVDVKRVIDCEESVIKTLKTGETEVLDLPKSDVLKYVFEDDSWFAVRPSGTEPKIKIYVSSLDKNEKLADEKLASIMKEVAERLESIE